MSPKAQRIAIAEACPSIAYVCRPDRWGNQGGQTFYVLGHRKANQPFDPISDLNAMHEAEEVLSGDKFAIYFEALTVAFGFPSGTMAYFGPGHAFALVHATATQRAEAFLRTLNLWDDLK